MSQKQSGQRYSCRLLIPSILWIIRIILCFLCDHLRFSMTQGLTALYHALKDRPLRCLELKIYGTEDPHYQTFIIVERKGRTSSIHCSQNIKVKNCSASLPGLNMIKRRGMWTFTQNHRNLISNHDEYCSSSRKRILFVKDRDYSVAKDGENILISPIWTKTKELH